MAFYPLINLVNKQPTKCYLRGEPSRKDQEHGGDMRQLSSLPIRDTSQDSWWMPDSEIDMNTSICLIYLHFYFFVYVIVCLFTRQGFSV